MRVGIVTCWDHAQLTDGEKPLMGMFEAKGITAIPVVWNDPKIEWEKFDFLILRSIWDCHIEPPAFKNWLSYLREKAVPVLNPVSTVEYNYHKFYLQHLQMNGVEIVPTIFVDRMEYEGAVVDLIPQDWNTVVVKPAISASAFKTKLFWKEEFAELDAFCEDIIKDRDLLIQQFIPEIQSVGETSIMFFDRRYSHSVLKTAKRGEFRVQQELGGQISLTSPSSKVLEQAEGILSLIDGELLYARLDGVVQEDVFLLMELELVEPELYFNHFTKGRQSFVDAAITIMNRM